jgi:hypothetical protein
MARSLSVSAPSSSATYRIGAASLGRDNLDENSERQSECDAAAGSEEMIVLARHPSSLLVLTMIALRKDFCGRRFFDCR